MRVIVLHNQPGADSAVDELDVLAQRDAVVSALGRLGHEASCLGCTLDLEAARCELLQRKPDLVFNLVEALGGTDRLMGLATLLLDALEIPYTGTRTEALLTTSNKLLAKQRLAAAGLPTPAWRESTASMSSPDVAGQWILKPILEHASFGMDDAAVVTTTDAADLQARLASRAQQVGRPLFAEQFIAGREFNLSLLGANPVGSGTNAVEVLPPAEIDFAAYPPEKPRIVGHQAKWDPESFEYQQTPRRFDFAPSDATLLKRLADLARSCWDLFGLHGYARVDFRVDETGQPWILEVNANPCLSLDAGFAAAVSQAGIPYELAIQRILEDSEVGSAQSSEVAFAKHAAVGSARSPGVSANEPRLRYDVTAADRESVRRMVAATGFFRPDEVDVAVELVDERLTTGAASGYEFVFVELDGQTVGYACYGPISCTLGSYDLYWIAVDPVAQGRGLGRVLVCETERLIRQLGGRCIYIETSGRPQYAPTRGFYERCGYAVVAVLPEFYDRDDDKVIWAKSW